MTLLSLLAITNSPLGCTAEAPPAPNADTASCDSARHDAALNDAATHDTTPHEIAGGDISSDLASEDAAILDIPDEDLAQDIGVDDVPPPPRTCNGAATLCSRRYNEVAYVTTHNAMSNEEDGFIAPNQYEDIPTQLADGVRGLMLDTHDYEGEAYLCHGPCILGSQLLVDGLTSIRRFLDETPDAVVTIIFEAYISEEETAAAFEAAGLRAYLDEHLVKKQAGEDQTSGEPWPTLGEMIDSGHRLVVFSDEASGAIAWHHPLWDACFETDWDISSIDELDCDKRRGSPSNALFILNHFITAPFAKPELAEQANANPFFEERALSCQERWQHIPNFVTVDFYSIGDVFDVVSLLNAPRDH